MSDKPVSLPVILGDGVGHDVLPVATESNPRGGGRGGGGGRAASIRLRRAPLSRTRKRPLPEDVEGLVRGLAERHDAILFGSAGLDPRIPEDVNCRDLLRALRFELDLYVNLRPAPLLHPDFCPP